LPAAAATTMPTLTALLVATPDGSSGLPKPAPNDMLMTSTWSEMSPSWLGSIAHSMPSVVRPVEWRSSAKTLTA
jgi:hypothetical protein